MSDLSLDYNGSVLISSTHYSFYSSVGGATFFTTLTGFSWAITQWAPFSLVSTFFRTLPR